MCVCGVALLPIALLGHSGHSLSPETVSEWIHLLTDWGHWGGVILLAAVVAVIRWRKTRTR